MTHPTIDSVLEQIAHKLNLSKESEWELIEEIRAHLEDAVDAAKGEHGDETVALLKAAEQFGIEETTGALNELHGEWEIMQVLLLCIVPVFSTIVLRWLVFDASGTSSGWPQLFDRPVLMPVGAAALVIPIWYLRRWPVAQAGWVLFWGLSLLFMAFPAYRIW